MVVFGQTACIRAGGCIWAKVVVFVQIGCIWAKGVVFGKTDCIWAKLVVVGQNW